jgi:PadR family transcriptional regulator PadR
MSREGIGHFELTVLLAILRVGDEAYGVPIAQRLQEATGREPLLGSVYAALDRLEAKGLVTSAMGEATAERGGRAKKYFRVTARGLRQVREVQESLVKLWSGVPQLGGGAA